MPNGKDFQKQLAEWESQTKVRFESIQSSTQRLKELEQQYVATAKPAEWVPSWLRWSPLAGYAAWGPWSPAGIRAKIKPQIEEVESNRRVDEFYYRLYSEVPFAIQSGVITSSDEALAKLPQELISSLSPEDLDAARTVIDEMVAAITGVAVMPEMARDMPEMEMPELIAPTELEADRVPMATLNRLTIDEIIKALVPPPQLPSPVLSEAEWTEFLSARQGGIDDPEADYLASESERLIDEWQERNNQLVAYKESIAEMPDYTLVDMLKEMVVQPGLALMEIAMIYFEHVSMPLAGALYKNFVPDMEKSYQEFRKTESTWKSLQMAWEEWDAPGQGAWEFILKYILMEGIVDPLSYVGWGIATRITKPLGRFGRVVGAAERGVASAFEIPFDLLKAGLRKLPKSLSQRAALEQAKSIQFVQKWVERYTGKSVRDLSKSPRGMVAFNKAIERAIRNALRHPQADTDVARAGKVLLEHTPVDEKMVMDWGNRLLEVANQPGRFTPETVSRELVDNINNLFEDYFTRGGPGRQKLTIGEAARELMVRLNIENTDDAWKLAQRILDDRANFIVEKATAIGQARTPVNAIYALGKRNFRIFLATEDSTAYLARKQMGVFATTMQDISLRVQQVWRNQIDRWVVRPFAEAYLAFALYGPMNIIEDIFRSALGGVIPNRFNPTRFARKWLGISYDPNLMRDAWSETLGELRKAPEAMRNNWIMSFGGLAKGFGEKTYGILVEKPGQIGISFRRGFVDARATQILKEMGGDTFEMLVKIDAPRPKLADKKFAKEVYQAVNDLKLSASPDSIRYTKELFTRSTIHKREVTNILSEHPDMPRAVREKLLKDMDDGTLIGNPEQITTRIDESRDILMDDFIRSPDRASEQMKALADMLTDLEIRNPEEMSRVMYSLNYMAQVQGAVPKQMMKRVTQRTRGLPFEERSASINADMDRLSLFLENSKIEMQRVADKIKLTLEKPEEMIDWSKVKFGEGISPKLEGDIRAIVDRLPIGIKSGLREIRISRQYREVVALYEPKGGIIHFASAEIAKNPEVVYHELGHSIAETVEGKRIINMFAEEFGEQFAKAEERFAQAFAEYLIEPEVFAKSHPKSFKLLEEYLPRTQRPLDLSPELVIGYNRYYDTLMAKSINASDNRMADIARRREYFARATAKDLKDPDFWEQFYLETDSFWERFDLEQLDFDDLLQSVAKEMSQIQGVKYPTRPPVKVTDRALSPQDIATVMQVRMDDITKSLMESMMLRQDRARFTRYVMNHVTPDDVGFTPESVGQVYDQILWSLQTDPKTVDWMTPRLKELQDINNQLHQLYNSKLLPDTEIAEIGRYVDDIARQVDNIAYEAVPRPIKGVGEIITGPEWREMPIPLNQEVILYKATVVRPADTGIQLLGKGTYATPTHQGATRWGKGVVGIKAKIRKALLVDPETPDLVVRADIDRELRAVGHTNPEALSIGEVHDWLRKEGYDAIVGKVEKRGFDDILIINKEAIIEYGVKAPPPKVVKPVRKQEFKDYDSMRQTAMDEAHKWYYKEFTDYTSANAFDAIMKTIYPYWTYESQRLFWLPRSFVRHPGTFAGFERWQNNTDYGYIHIPGTAIDYNPWRGTVYGTLTTRLARRDFPEYYDEFGVAGDFIEFSDFLSRYGFYPGAHIGIPLAVFGGVEAQFGEVMPAIPKTGLDFLIATFPENESVRFLSDKIFGDRFRNYLTILQVARRGGDGSLIFSKMQENKELTDEEKQLWADARREVGWYTAGFEQFAIFRMRTDEQYKMYEESSKVIEEMTGYTPEQQDWLRKHGYRLWDMVGGMSPTEQAALQELEYYKWIGNVRPLLPGRQQTILNQIELAWDDVRGYSEQLLGEKLVLQKDFLAGRIGSRDYGDKLSATYSKQRAYIDRKIEENPMMDIDNRVEYYKKYNVPQPVLHPMRELMNLYFEIELEEKIDEETGEKIKDWSKFWAMRDAIDQAIPDDYREEWSDYLKKNSTSLEQLRREHNQYIKPYNELWQRIIEEYTPEEQRLIKEHQYLVKTGTGLERRAEIEATLRGTTGRKLISNFRSDISNARQALRYANPFLDAVLYYWGRTTTFQTPLAEEAYKQLARDTGKSI